MELRHLKYAIAVAEELHFTRAAARLGIGQPPLSQQIKQMEEELGTQLFYRKARSVELTPAGDAFMPFARDALAAAENAKDAARRAARGELGQLSLGLTGAASFNPHISNIISLFRETYPGIEIQLVERGTESLIDELTAGRVDTAFLRPAGQSLDSFTYLPLPSEVLTIALPRHHKLATEYAVELRDLRKDPFVFYPRERGKHLYDSMISACRNAGFSPEIKQLAPQLTSVINLVSAGIGVAIVPKSMDQVKALRVVYKPLLNTSEKAEIGIAYKSNSQLSTVQNFIKCANQILSDVDT